MNTRPLMELRVEVGAAQEIGAVPGGTRRTVPLAGGTFDGRLRGAVLPGGSADGLLVRADGVLELDFRATLRTDDGALIAMRSFGLRHGPADVIRLSAAANMWIRIGTTFEPRSGSTPRILRTRLSIGWWPSPLVID